MAWTGRDQRSVFTYIVGWKPIQTDGKVCQGGANVSTLCGWCV